jgi:hypothetical protein
MAYELYFNEAVKKDKNNSKKITAVFLQLAQ